MREYLKELGIHEKDVDALCKLNPELEAYDPKKARTNIAFLKDEGCSDLYIRNIIINNTYFLNNEPKMTQELIEYLKEDLEFKDLDLLFDSNAYLLNLEKKYLQDFVKEKKQAGKTLEEIRDLIELNLFIMEEQAWKEN